MMLPRRANRLEARPMLTLGKASKVTLAIVKIPNGLYIQRFSQAKLFFTVDTSALRIHCLVMAENLTISSVASKS